MNKIDLSDPTKVRKKGERVFIKIKVNPNSDEGKIRETEGPYLQVDLEASPERGKANRELLELLSEFLDVKMERIRIRRGRKSRKKEVYIRGDSERLEEKINEL